MTYASAYPNGSTRETMKNDSDGKVHGDWCQFYPNGTPKMTASYQHGVLHGDVSHYREDGRLERTATYQDGVQVYAAGADEQMLINIDSHSSRYPGEFPNYLAGLQNPKELDGLK